MKKLYLLFMAFSMLTLNKSNAQTASITNPSSSATISAGGSVSFTGARSGSYNGSGSYTYSWAASPSSSVSFSPGSSTTNSSSSNTSATFGTAGTYAVTVTVSRGSSSATSSATTVYVNPASSVSTSSSSGNLTMPTSCSTTLNSSFTANGNTLSSIAWTESSSDAVVANIASPSASSTGVSFMVAGTYNFTVTATYTCQYGGASSQTSSNISITVNPGSTSSYSNNLFALSGSGTEFSGFAVGRDSVQSGMVINGMNNLAGISVTSSTAALGEDAAGYFYFIPNVTNTGSATIYAMNANGSSQTSIATTDINGSSDNSNLGFVRLGIDANGMGWILASNNKSQLYLANFKANGLAQTTINIINSNVGVDGGGSPSTFSSGDLAFDNHGVMYALANDPTGNTFIYTMTPSLNSNYVTLKWTLVDPNGNNFTGTVNGCAFDSAGSMYISTANGLYFIDATTVNTAGVGTVKTRLAYNGSGFTDLATNVFPDKTTLPVEFISFSVTQQNSNALLQWSTEAQVNNDYYDVERSPDGLNFTGIGKVASVGNPNTVQNYQYSDNLSGLSGVIYYRIKEVDQDGNSYYSSTLALHLDGALSSTAFSAYPNPFASSINISASSSIAQNGELVISNIAGQQVIRQQISLLQGQNTVLVGNLNNLQPGIYFVQLITGQNTITQKLVKQ